MGTLRVDNKTTLKAVRNPSGVADLLGFTAPNDGNGNLYFWSSGDYSALVDDNNYIASDHVSDTLGAWLSFNLYRQYAEIGFYENAAGLTAASSPSVTGTVAYIQGDTTRNDGGQTFVYWDNSDVSDLVSDGLAFAPDTEDGSNGGWVIIFPSDRTLRVHVGMFGIVDDSGATNQISAFRKLGDWLRTHQGATVVFPANALIKTQYFDYINVQYATFEGNGTRLIHEPVSTSTYQLLRNPGPTIPFPVSTNFGNTSYAIDTVGVNSITVTLSTISEISNFSVGNEVVIYGCPILYTGYPSANRFFEYNKITAIDVGTGVITLETETKYNYYDDWDDQPAAIFNINTSKTTNKAQAYDPYNGTSETDLSWTYTWAKDLVFRNFTFDINQPDPDDSSLIIAGGKQNFYNCKFIGKLNITQSTDVLFEACDFSYVPKLELDKFVRHAEFRRCIIAEMSEGSGVETIIVDDCDIIERYTLEDGGSNFKSLSVSPRFLTIERCRIRMTNFDIGLKWGTHTANVSNNTFLPNDTRRQVDANTLSRYGLMPEASVDTYYPYETITVTAISSGEIVVGASGSSDSNVSNLHKFAKEGTLFFNSTLDYSLMLERIAINGSGQAVLKGTLIGDGTPAVNDVLRYYKLNYLNQSGNRVQGKDSLLYFFHARGAQITGETRFERIISKKDNYQDIQIEGYIKSIVVDVVSPTQSSDAGTSAEEFKFVLDGGTSDTTIDFSTATVTVDISTTGRRVYKETSSTGIESGDTAMASGISTELTAPYYCRTIRYWMVDEINSSASTAYDNPPLIKFIVEWDPRY